MPIDLRKALDTDNPKWDKLKANYKKVETGAWRALDPVGRWTNRTAGKFGAESFWPTEMDLECDKAARILRTFATKGAQVEVDASQADVLTDKTAAVPPTQQPQVDAKGKKIKDPHKYDHKKTQKVLRRISPKVLSQAQGLAIFTVFRTGFGFSGASGSGVVLSRLPDGSWSAPSGLLVHTIGWGFLIGLDIYDVVIVLRSQKAVDAFKNPKISLGAELTVAAGPVGDGAMVETGVDRSASWSYIKSKGFYAGVQLDGTVVLKRDDANTRFYGSPLPVKDILEGRLQAPAPAACLPLWQTIYAAEGRPQVMGVDRIPQGDMSTPGDLVMTEDDFKQASVVAEHGGMPHGDLASGAGASAVGSTMAPGYDRVVPPPPGAGASGAAAPAPAPAPAPYGGELPPDYDFASAPLNAQGGKTFNDAPSGYTNVPAAAVASGGMGGAAPPNPFASPSDASAPVGGHETAEQEKERLRQQYAQNDAQYDAPPAGPAPSQSGGATSAGLPSSVEALYDFEGQEAGDLPFKAGDVIQVVGKEDESWWRGSLKGRQGIFPSNYTRPL
ncbi:related to YSC84 - protein involved in the organization of the actin cytoskeleton [Pseudozyma flocculosa]|uniref:Related to YSC84 - protein involved in the organization of the actin cytoskeleton n=1 Tax=Pseudozyma flocculosa TaxID=84751 RepID=A0A5C3ET91_9BASI|nr:related to YSC84 - protein involved in the organization of the actin cytoskeleton [Pseudozyma flocculosa]